MRVRERHMLRSTFHVLRFTALLLLTGALVMGSVRLVAAADDGPGLPEPTVLDTSQTGITLEWHAPVFSQRPVSGDDGRAYVALDALGWEQSQTPGKPQLPLTSALLIAPPTGEVTLQVQVLERERRVLPHPVAPAPEITVVGDSPARPARLEPVWARDALAYSTRLQRSLGAQHAPEWVTLEEAGWMRGRRLMRLTFSPLSFDPGAPAVEIASRVRVEVHFEEAAGGRTEGACDDRFASLLQDTVLNPAQVCRFVSAAQRTDLPETIKTTNALADPPGGADYLIIGPQAFLSAVAPLADHRANHDGLRVHSAAVETIYEAYSEDAPQDAIKNYISHAYHNWVTPTLSYVLLVGDGSEIVTDTQYVPPYMIPDPWGYEANGVASDNRYVTMDGPDDQAADMFIGRLPVNSVAETEAVVQKILSYERNPPQTLWNERVLLVAGHRTPEEDEDFHAHSDWLYNTLPDGFDGQRIYHCTQNCIHPYQYNNLTTTHQLLMDALNQGGLLVSYEGHSSWHQWDYHPETYAPLFHLHQDVENLQNQEALPMVLEPTCYTSRFADPGGDTLDESLLRLSSSGAVATWGNTTLGLDSGHKVLRERFFYQLFDQGNLELGPVIEFSKAGLSDRIYNLRDTFILLGDPAMDLHVPENPWRDIFLPLVMRGG